MLNLIFLVYLVILVGTFWNIDGGCTDKLDTFLWLLLITQAAHLIRKYVLISIWRRDKDPSVAQTKFEIFFMILVNLPELGLYIYGNTMIYSDEVV